MRVLTELGYRVLEADGAARARELVAEGGAPDLLLTDVIMPRSSGPELARELREAGLVERVLYVSGFADDERLRRAGVALDARVLRKPFTPAGLATAVRDVLDETRAQRSSRPST